MADVLLAVIEDKQRRKQLLKLQQLYLSTILNVWFYSFLEEDVFRVFAMICQDQGY